MLRIFKSNYSVAANDGFIKHLKSSINISGPMSVYSFMRNCLTYPKSGYYMNRDVFGTTGDFITSPEISQMFGEMLGIWFITQLEKLTTFYKNDQLKIRIVELGPGRGTLMSDMIHTWTQFPKFRNAIDSIHFVEASPALHLIQAKKFKIIHDDNTQSLSRGKGIHGINMQWHEHLEDVPAGLPTFVVAHELFDALPIFILELTDKGWREVLVDVDYTNNQMDFCFVLAKASTQASITLTKDDRFSNCKIGDRVEISPEAARLSIDISKRISIDGGSALIIDYGNDHFASDSLRGIQKHKFTHVLSNPGNTDLSSDVDFSLLKQVSHPFVNTHGPITQSEFLRNMGIATRMMMLLKTANESNRRDIASAFERLIGTNDDQMGNAYKFLAMTSKKLPKDCYPFEK